MAITDLPEIARISHSRYKVHLSPEFCNFGLVHGGYLSAVLCKAATTYIVEEEKIALPHTHNFHLEYLRPCRPTRADIDIEPVRKGSSLATVQATVYQGGQKTVTGFITNVDFGNQEGLSFPSASKLHPPPKPRNVAEFDKDNDSSEGWLPVIFPRTEPLVQHNMTHWKRMVHTDIWPDLSLADQWIAWKYPSAKWTNEWLPHLADNTTGVAENYQNRGGTGIRAFVEYAQKIKSGEWSPDKKPVWDSNYWYPTLNLSLEVKKLVPPATRWLFMRAQVKKISNGRLGTEILILDEDLDLVAVAHDITLIKDVEWKARAKEQGRASPSAQGGKL